MAHRTLPSRRWLISRHHVLFDPQEINEETPGYPIGLLCGRGSISCLCLHKNDRFNAKTSRFVAASSLFGTELKGASSMVTKSSKKSTGAKRVKVKVPKLKLRKETLKDLSGLKGKAASVKGGGIPSGRPGCTR